MPIRCGSEAVSKVYCGADQVARVYCGRDLVFGQDLAGPLPIIIEELEKTGVTIADRSGQGMVGSVNEGIMFGGFSSSAQNDFYRFAVSGENVHSTLLTKTGDAISGRDGVSMAGDVSAGVLFGGSVGGGSINLTDQFFRFVITNDTVAVSALTATVTNFAPRSQSAAIGDVNSGIIFGGHTTTPVSDFYRYVVVGNIITITPLTKIGSIPGRVGFGLVGNALTGLIFGGWNNSGHLGDFFRYSVSGNNVTLTNLTISGTIPPLYYMGMTGTDTVGVIFGGSSSGKTSFTDFTFPVENKFYRYAVSGNAVTITQALNSGDVISPRSHLSMVGDSHTGLVYGGWSGATGQRLGGPFRYSLRDISIPVPTQATSTGTQYTKSGTISNRQQVGMVGTVALGLIFGGSTGVYNNDMYRYASSNNATTITRLNVVGSPNVVADPLMIGSETAGIIFGGQTTGNVSVSSFYRYVVSSNTATFTQFGQTVIPARSGVEGVGDVDSGIFFGGTHSGVLSNTFYRYETTNTSVTITALSEVGSTMPSLAGVGMAGSQTTGVIFGGQSAHLPNVYENDFYRYQISGDEVTTTKLNKVGDDISDRALFGMIGDHISGLIFGGWLGSAPTNEVYFYRVTGNYVYVKRLVNVGTFPGPRNSFGMVGTSTSALVFGGYNGSRFLNDFGTIIIT